MEDLKLDLEDLVRKQVANSIVKTGIKPQAQAAKSNSKNQLKEAFVVTPDSFILKTEKLSLRSKETHMTLYKQYIDKFNKTSAALDSVNRHEASSNGSNFRSLKMDECYNLNAIKLHELYFDNISDLASEVSVDSLPFMRLSRDFGTFENWQFDFIACALSSREGWAITVYEPHKNAYFNVCIDDHTCGIPLGCVPVIVLDMWSHAYFKDYDIEKKSYVISMMKEFNWDVIEARMIVAEKSDLNAIYAIKPIYNNNPEKMLANVDTNAPIDKVVMTSPQGEKRQVSPNTPPAPEQMRNVVR